MKADIINRIKAAIEGFTLLLAKVPILAALFWFIDGAITTLTFALWRPIAFAAFIGGLLPVFAQEIIRMMKGDPFDWRSTISAAVGALAAQAFIWLYMILWSGF